MPNSSDCNLIYICVKRLNDIAHGMAKGKKNKTKQNEIMEEEYAEF